MASQPIRDGRFEEPAVGKTGLNKSLIPHLRKVLGDLPTFDRTSINAREDAEFVQAVNATGHKKLIMTALRTEACLTFPALTVGEQDGLSTWRLRYGR